MGKYSKPKTEKAMPPQQSVVMYLHDLVYLLVAIILLFSLFLRVVVVSGPSMYHTLVDGDYLFLLSNVFYKNPKQGDIVVVSKQSFDNGTPIIKRVIATEGQTVDIDFTQGIVSVDGEALKEPYTYTDTNLYEGVDFPLTVKTGFVFVLGDNRNDSMDSRDPKIGLIDKREILGRVLIRFLPGTNGGKEPFAINRIGVVS